MVIFYFSTKYNGFIEIPLSQSKKVSENFIHKRHNRKNFIPNELFLTQKNFVNIITWPNMGWKSTYLR